jgi:hypothetical protein
MLTNNVNLKVTYSFNTLWWPLTSPRTDEKRSDVKWVACHHMLRPQVADGGDGLKVWTITANILNKQ